MFRKLHIQMTLFSTLITGLVLTAMSCICLYIAESGMRENNFAAFLNNSNACITHLENQTVLTHQWLLEMQQSYGFLMDIQDNGRSLFFEELNSLPDTRQMMKKAREMTLSSYGIDLSDPKSASTLTKSAHFAFTLDGHSYYGKAAMIPKKNGAVSMLLLYPLDSLEQQIADQRLYFLLACCFGIFLLSIFSWFFTGRMLKPMEESRKRQTEFISAASHELRSPLAVILSSISAIKKSDAREAEHFLNNMEQEGNRMSRLVEDMLALANADNHSWTVRIAPAELDTLLLQTYEKYEPLAQEKHVHLQIVLPSEPVVPFPCDSARIAQVLSILTDNALSYVPDHGTITLSLLLENSRPVLQVSDNGPGIPDNQKLAVFQRFYRADLSRQSREHFGLGLSIAKEIVGLHNGKLLLTDTPGGGATFRILL